MPTVNLPGVNDSKSCKNQRNHTSPVSPVPKNIPIHLHISGFTDDDCRKRSTVSELMMEQTIADEPLVIKSEDVQVKIEEDISIHEDQSHVSNTEYDLSLCVKQEPQDSMEECFENEERNFSMKVTKEVPEYFSLHNGSKLELIYNSFDKDAAESLSTGGYIVPENLDEMLNNSETSPTAKSVQKMENKLLFNDLVQYDVPVLVHSSNLLSTAEIPSSLEELETQPRSRRKQVLMPKSDLEDEVCQEMTENWKKPTNYVCKECGQSFVMREYYVRHIRNHAKQKQLKCALCFKSCKTLEDLSDHSHSHKDGPPFKCIVCERDFQTAGSLSRHLSLHPGMKPYKCSNCNDRFTSVLNCNAHERTCCVHATEDFKCSSCTKVFDSSTTLQLHTCMHTLERPYKCCYCKSSFISFKSLSLHTRNSHSGKTEHKCTLCGESFSHGLQLIHHVYRSSGTCAVCSIKFKSGCELNQHMKVHLKEKANVPLKECVCKVCHVTFFSRNQAHKHVFKCHPAELDLVKRTRYLLNYIHEED